jgi:ATP-dependent Lhr-like helicase
MSTSKRSRPHASRNQALTLRNASPPTTAGRWSRWQPDRPTDATTRALAVAESLLDRYGVLAREAARGEIEGGFSTLYPALRALEESGRARRGYFVAGLGGAQFARAGADDRLRALRESEGRRDAIETVTIAACDPANPYGSILAWPRAIDAAAPSTRPSRVSGATVILRAGALLGWLSRVDGRLATFLPVDEAERAIATRALVEAIADRLEGPTPGVLLLTEIDGISAVQSPLAPALERAGFRAHADGLLRRRPPNASPRLVNDDA